MVRGGGYCGRACVQMLHLDSGDGKMGPRPGICRCFGEVVLGGGSRERSWDGSVEGRKPMSALGRARGDGAVAVGVALEVPSMVPPAAELLLVWTLRRAVGSAGC